MNLKEGKYRNLFTGIEMIFNLYFNFIYIYIALFFKPKINLTMKPLFLSTLIAFACYCNNSQAQQFINGNLKPDGTLPQCTQSMSSTYNANMGNSWANTGPDEVFVGDSSCSGSAAIKHFIGVEWTPTLGGVNVVFKLDKPMLANTQYKFSFQYRTAASGDAAFPIWYYNNDGDSLGHDSIINAIAPPLNATWTTVLDSVTPKVDCRFLSLRAGSGTSGAYSQTYIAKLQMLGVPGVNVEEVSVNNDAQITPNPSTGIVHVQLNKDTKEVLVYNVTGNMVYRAATSGEKEIQLDLGNLPKGMYFVAIAQPENKNFTKVILQ